ncbi:hypothetical protein OQJ19_16845 [Fluoribacter gormanii]|uniref:Uncharacterized protein n=1 Tax=Legionella qingyii TaxID=2184757 RepID=A0A317U209_9GAMM|nr:MULTISPECIES: hypothetical protein [Legionellaceae]MCW8472300.1 hypothetical protein [Fluoribacter gormanii]PWY54766.1 hypothetical protein DGG96_15415 [Legionella qingyii]RUR20840.1 hypothetical protein ELY20_14350 [Legionella qingyii]
MEITIDIGADTRHSLNKIAKMNSTELNVTAAEMLSFGARIYLQSLEKKTDESTQLLLENSVRSVQIITEVLYSVYNKELSKIGAYDAETALAMIERMLPNLLKSIS